MAGKKRGERQPLVLNDPRRDPTDPPPGDTPKPVDGKPSVSEAGVAPIGVESSRSRSIESDSEPPSSRRQPESPRPASLRAAGSVGASIDPRILELEPLVASANWEAVAKLLGTPEVAGQLPSNLGLVYALARKETGVAKEEDYEPNVAAIQCMAAMFGVPNESPIALVLGKRLLRSNPVAWQKAPAPPTYISLFIVAIGLAIGAGIGWMLSFGYVTFRLPALPFFN